MKFTYSRIVLILVILVIVVSGTLFHFVGQANWEPELEELYAQGKDAYYQGDLVQAIAVYKKILSYDPTQRAALDLGVIYEEQGDFTAAAHVYQHYLLENPGDNHIWVDLAIVEYNLGQLSKAKAELIRLLETTQLDSILERDAAYYLSKIFFQEGNETKALQYARQAIEMDSRFALAYVQLGIIYEQQKELDQALNSYLHGLKLDGSMKGIQKRLGMLYLAKGDIDQAYQRFDRALQENSQDQMVGEKIIWLESEYPGRFSRSTDPPKPQDFPKEVTFREISPLSHGEEIKKIRVGLAGGDPQPVVFFRVGTDFQFIDATGKVIGVGKEGQIWEGKKEENKLVLQHYPDGQQISSSQKIRVRPNNYAPILIHQVRFGEGYYWAGRADRQYRGELELLVADNGITLVNIVNVEEYLYSVVPSEMPASWPLEALKVQTVAARTYTYFNLSKHREEGFDLCDTVHCAAYNGIGWERQVTRQAVQETRGEVMSYQGRPINAVYSANSGGHTEDAVDVWNYNIPYLQGVTTGKDLDREFPLEPADLKEWLRSKPDSYSDNTNYTNPNHYRWQRLVSKDYIEAQLNIGTLEELRVSGRGVGGSITAISAKGTEGQMTLKSSLRSKLGGLRSTRFYFRPEYQDGELVGYLFFGGGWGHSVGMDQVAAAAMAESGWSYDRILQHFYTDIDIKAQY